MPADDRENAAPRQEPDRGDGPFRVGRLPRNHATPFDLRPQGAELAAIAEALSLLDLRKLRFAGEIRPGGDDSGKAGAQAGAQGEWLLEGVLGATVVQPCVVTLSPVTTRIDAPVLRHYVPEIPAEETDGEVEMPEDETLELLEAEIDPRRVMQEALALALPDYPRAAEAELGQSNYAPPGVEPLTDEGLRPFAGLAELRKKLED